MNESAIFERQVELALRALDVFSGPNVNIFRNKVYPGSKDPNGYEIDIAFEMSLSEGLSLLVIVECKSHSRPVDRAVVQHLIQVRDDISAHKAMVISSKGFQSGAVRLAKSSRIALWQFVDRRFLHVAFHMQGIRDQRSRVKTALNGFGRYLANRGVELNFHALGAEELRGSEGEAIYEVGFFWNSKDPDNPEVHPPPSVNGLAIYETPCGSDLGVTFAFEVIEAILGSGTEEAPLLRAHLRVARDPWTDGPEYASFIDRMWGDSSNEDSSNPFARIDFKPCSWMERDREREERTRATVVEDAKLREFLRERGELKW